MAEAKRVMLGYSTDKVHPTGAVVVKDGKIIGSAANQSALRNKYLLDFHKKYFCVRRFFKIKSGEKYWLCPGCASHRMHAEPRSINDAREKYGTSAVKGADIYLWGHWWCCKPCWDSMIKSGIKNVYLVENATDLFKGLRDKPININDKKGT
jgi:tRNA(Arg) A34 adenosine deaminase TadA